MGVDQPHATDQQTRTPAFWENFSRKIILPRISVRSPSEQAATRTVRNHLRQCESSRELVILKLVRCNAINETGKKKKKIFTALECELLPFLRLSGRVERVPRGPGVKRKFFGFLFWFYIFLKKKKKKKKKKK